MSRTPRILVASGAMKDVFSPVETCEMIRGLLAEVAAGAEVTTLPMADGGEYSDEVLAAAGSGRWIDVPEAVDPLGRRRGARYLASGDTAFIASYRTLALPPADDAHRNPLRLTSYGLGQMIQDAYRRGFGEVVVGMGGTATVDGGLGLGAALGGELLDGDGRPLAAEHPTGEDLRRVRRIRGPARRAPLTVLCDTRISVAEMGVPTDLKISRRLPPPERTAIADALAQGLESYTRIVAEHLGDDPESLLRRDGLGVAGGVLLSLLWLTDARLLNGVDFVAEHLGLEEALGRCDLVVTAEGKLDISLEGKTPAGVSRLARQHGKPVLYLCGDVGPELRGDFPTAVTTELPAAFRDSGVSAVVSCHPAYARRSLPAAYADEVALYREHTPLVLADALRELFRRPPAGWCLDDLRSGAVA